MSLVFGVAAGVFALCAVLRLCMAGEKPHSVWGGRIRIKPMENPIGGFGLPLRRKPLILGSLAVLAVFLTQTLPGWRAGKLGTGLVIGGSAANLHERLRFGKVTDYLRLPNIPGKVGRLVFNGADLAIFAGLFLFLMRSGRRKKR